jgi:capsule polysaccharide export protein KpsE/RkpR
MANSGLFAEMTDPIMPGLRLLRLRWKLVAVLGVVGLAAGIAYYLWMPKWYQAGLLIVPKRRSPDLSAASKLIGNVPLDLGDASPFGQSDADRIAAILQSRSVSDDMITRFDLVNRYHTGVIERARKVLWSHCSTEAEKKPNLVRLTCEDMEPEVARDLANAIGRAGDGVFRRIATASAREEREVLEKQVADARRELQAASDKLRQFQESHKVIDLPAQGKAIVSGMATLEGNLISKRMELAYARGYASNDEASVAQLRRQVDLLSAELRGLEDKRATPGATAPPSGSEVFPPAMELPALGAELEALVREHKIRETLFLMLTERYEARKMEEARELSAFVIADEAALPTFRVRPTLRVLPVGLLTGIALGVLIILVPAWWRDLRRRAALEAPPGAA